MLPAGRMLVGFSGQAPEDNLIRYAAMVARMYRPDVTPHGHRELRRGTSLALAQPAPATRWLTHHRAGAGEQTMCELPEIRFVSLLARPGSVEPSPRAAVAAKVQAHFDALPRFGLVNVDLLKGRALQRFAALAADFDTDVLLLDNAAESHRKCARFAVEAPCTVWLVSTAWAPVLRRILVPIDFSYRAAASMQAAVDLASRFRPAKCIALHVEQDYTRTGDDTFTAARRHELAVEFQRFMATIDVRGVRIEPMFVKSHRIDRAIERASAQHATDLTVMICRRRARLTCAIDPCLAEMAIRECSGPVLLLKSAEKPLGLLEAVRNRLNQDDFPLYA